MKIYFKILFTFLLMFCFSSLAKAEEITDYQTIYYYRRSNDNVSRTYGYLPTSSQPINGITLDGTLNNSTYFNYLTGYNNKINYNFASGLDYIITTRLSFNNIEGFAYHGTDPNDPLLGYGWCYNDASERLVNFSKVGTSNVNLISTNVSTKSTSCYEGYDDMDFCTYNVTIIQRVHINTNINQLSIGSYTTSDYTIGVWKHLYDSLVSVTSVDVVADTDSTIIEQNQQTNQKLDDINNSITNDSPVSMDKLGNTAGWLPAGPVDSILNLPLSLMNSLSTSLNTQCSPLQINVPFINTLVEIPCLSTIFGQIEGLPNFWSWVGAIASCLILYKYLLNLYAWVDNVLMLRLEMHEDFGGNSTNFGSV